MVVLLLLLLLLCAKGLPFHHVFSMAAVTLFSCGTGDGGSGAEEEDEVDLLFLEGGVVGARLGLRLLLLLLLSQVAFPAKRRFRIRSDREVLFVVVVLLAVVEAVVVAVRAGEGGGEAVADKSK